MRGDAWIAGKKYRARAQQREGGHHSLELGPEEFVLERLKPAKVKNLTFDTEKKSVQISVDEDQLSRAIGKKGQNARVTSRLTGWEINIGKDTSATTVVEQKVAQAAQTLAGALPVTQEQALT